MAGAEKVTFPAYQAHVLYDALDRRENKEVRELYVNPEALKSLKAGQPLPSGTVSSTPTFPVVRNDKGELVKDAHGRLVCEHLHRFVVMESALDGEPSMPPISAMETGNTRVSVLMAPWVRTSIFR